MPGTSLDAVVSFHNLRAVSKVAVQRGGETLAKQISGAQQSTNSLNTTVSGTDYPVFVPGVDDPDDVSVARWVL